MFCLEVLQLQYKNIEANYTHTYINTTRLKQLTTLHKMETVFQSADIKYSSKTA